LRKSGRGEEEVLKEEEERNEPKGRPFLISYLRKIIGGLSFVFLSCLFFLFLPFLSSSIPLSFLANKKITKNIFFAA